MIDGFKSYAHRTVVNGFDPHFNAITGLNGSGKSNILDSICFVLGITNLSQVRAGSLSELVYKQGQAGVNKASVTIIFNNEDEAGSPVGYEQCPEVTVTRQVLLGGKSKYLINGRVQPANQVQNLFHSVQLNVNNPHFLIMQGRITKVLNMKPHEILGMVEETAGTRMYETKKIAAIKTIEKKQTKVDELNTILSEEITPTLERLRGEKQSYLKWSKNNADIERIERFVVASEFMSAKNVLLENTESVEKMEAQMKELEEKVASLENNIIKKEDEFSQLTSDQSKSINSNLSEAKKNEDRLSKAFVKVSTAYKSSQMVVKNAKSDVDSAKSFVRQTTKAVDEKNKEIEAGASEIQTIKDEAVETEARVVRLQEEYQNMCAGIATAEGHEGRCLPEQISQAQNDSNTAEARAKQAKMKFTHLSKNIKSVEAQMRTAEKSSEKLSEKKALAKQKVDSLKTQIDSMDYSNDEFVALDSERDNLKSSINSLQQAVDTLTAQLQGRLAFEYSDPVRGFDRTKVKGLVARLVIVKDPKFATSLEVAAGGKLYQVVVDEAITGKALLNAGQLRRRVTIIPLDKIQSRGVTDRACQEARSIAEKLGSKAYPAIELVGFDEEVRNAIEYVFGATIVVDGMNAANRICDMTQTRTVTLEGDVYDPSGTISGGSKNNLGSTLEKLTELRVSKEQLDSAVSRLAIVEANWQSLKSQAKKFEEASNQYEVAVAELEAVEKHLSQTTYGMLKEKQQAMQKEIDEALEEHKIMEQEREHKLKLYNELKSREIELTQSREEKLKGSEMEIKKAKEVATKAAKKFREVSSEAETKLLELVDLSNELKAAEEALSSAEKALIEANSMEADKLILLKTTAEEYDEAKAALLEAEKLAHDCSVELNRLSKEKAKMSSIKDAAVLETKKISLQVAKFQKERSNAERFVASMLEKHAWIENEKDAFGVTGGDYDFQETDPKKMSERLNLLKGEQESLSKKINKKVMGMIEKAEGEYTELIRKRKVIENDKKKIQAVIEELDVKKKSELERTWKKVNADFGSIFSTLLPGASAKLEPPEGMKAWEGLEVKVAFGDVWKQSLTELSGGQRSLLALSLILSLLLFKPAPMYILDEVDAALDLSHTQNIGNMLKTHFSQSQFIVVSLKEGMFNNANVIFRTKFVDGVSTVTRTIGTGTSERSRQLAGSSQNVELDTNSPAKKRPARTRVDAGGKEN